MLLYTKDEMKEEIKKAVLKEREHTSYLLSQVYVYNPGYCIAKYIKKYNYEDMNWWNK